MSLLIVETDTQVHLVVVAHPKIVHENLDGLLGADCWIHQAFRKKEDAEQVAKRWNEQWQNEKEMAAVMSINLCELA